MKNKKKKIIKYEISSPLDFILTSIYVFIFFLIFLVFSIKSRYLVSLII